MLRWSAEPEPVALIEALPSRPALLEARALDNPLPGFPVRGEMSESDATVLFPTLRRGLDVFDPLVYFRRPAGLDFTVRAAEHPDGSWRIITNEIGLRQDWELAEDPPDLRVLVIGDSQISGVCPYSETIPGRLRERFAADYPDRRVEVVNAGKGAWTFHNYLGMVQRMEAYEPDVIVVASYAGNDYSEALLLHHYFARSAPPPHSKEYMARVHKSVRRTNGARTHSLLQAYYLSEHPEEEAVARGSSSAVTSEILATCAAATTPVVFVNIPTPFGVQPESYGESTHEVLMHLELDAAALAVNERLSAAWLASLRERGATVVDLTSAFESETQPLFWFTNHHLNGYANQIAAAELFPRLEAFLPGR